MPRLPVYGLGKVGVIKDIPPHVLAREAWSDANNVRFLEGGASTLYSQRDIFTAAAFAPTWIQCFPPYTDPLWVYGDDSRLYCYQSTPGHALIRNGFAAAGERWQGSIFQGLGIFNQRNNVPQLWSPMASGTASVDLTNWNTNADFGSNTRTWSLRSYRNFLMAMRIYNSAGAEVYPYRVRWSDAADPGAVPVTWAPAASNFAGQQDFAETLDYVMDGLTLGEAFMVYKEKSTWGLQLTGGGEVMRAWRVHDDVGLLYRDCMAAIPGGHVVCTQEDIIVHTGSPGSAQSILRDKLRDWVFSNLNVSAKNTCFMCQNPTRKEVWFFFPTGSASYPNRVLMWDWYKNRIGLREVAQTPFAASGPVKTATVDTWASGY